MQNIEQMNKGHDSRIKAIMPLTPTPSPISIPLKNLPESLLESAGLSSSKVSQFSIYNPHSLCYETVNSDSTAFSYIETNSPFLLFKVKARSERAYLYFTLTNQCYSSYKPSEEESIRRIYQNIFSEIIQTDPTYRFFSITETFAQNNETFCKNKINESYIDSLSILPDYQNRLSEITGISYLGFLPPELAQFEIHSDYFISKMIIRIAELQNPGKPIAGRRLDWRADTHQGFKPFFEMNIKIKQTPHLKEIYWLNNKHYCSNKEQLTPDSRIASMDQIPGSNAEELTLEDIMKTTFAKCLAYKIYYHEDLIPKSNNLSLVWWSYLYLIDCVGLGFKPVDDFNQTTACRVLENICQDNSNSDEETKDRNIELKNALLAIYPDRTIPSSLYKVQEPLFKIDPEFINYRICAFDFIPFLNRALVSISESEKTFNKIMYEKIFNTALRNYILEYKKNNYYLDGAQIEDMIFMVSKLYGVNVETLREFQLNNQMYHHDFESIVNKAQKLKNSHFI